MFYKTGVDITNSKDCFNFLHDHFTYDTMNSWNGLKSIANNVKVYNLNLDGDKWNALALLEEDEYFIINELIKNWEHDHKGYIVGFNGRSGGYLVLYNEHNNSNVLPDELTDDYEYFKQYCKDYYGSVKNYMSTLKEYVRLVQDFDKLCDELRDYVNELSKHDPIADIVNDRLALFGDKYYSELKDFNLQEPELDSGEIELSDEFMKHISLVDCLIDSLKSDVYKVYLKENKITLEMI